MRYRSNVALRCPRTRIVRSRRSVACVRPLNIGTCKEYLADQTENQPDLLPLTPEIEISYSPCHVSEEQLIFQMTSPRFLLPYLRLYVNYSSIHQSFLITLILSSIIILLPISSPFFFITLTS